MTLPASVPGLPANTPMRLSCGEGEKIAIPSDQVARVFERAAYKAVIAAQRDPGIVTDGFGASGVGPDVVILNYDIVTRKSQTIAIVAGDVIAPFRQADTY